jgi:filamentous hemagglutinin family protein
MTKLNHHRRLSRRGEFLVWTMIGLMMVYPLPPVIWALPSGESVSQGQVEFIREANRLTVNQASDKAIVNYDAFNISAGNIVQFNQPGSSAAILNRVTGGGSSTIAGALLANGRVYLINPAGILFSPSASVNVGALVASAMNMSDEDFMSGRLRFSGGGGSVVNQGMINAASVLLVGSYVENAGTINAAEVILAAGQQSVEIDEVEGGVVRIIIDGVAQEGTGSTGSDDGETASGIAPDTALPDADSEGETSRDTETQGAGQVVNTGSILAQDVQGGTVLLRGVDVEQQGLVDASGEGGGSIEFIAEQTVTLGINNLTLASAPEAGAGGTINVLGSRVGVSGGLMDASGAAGGGEILIGGDFGGSEERVGRASATVIAPEAVIRADALDEGEGGRIAIWGTDVVRYLGEASARGGAQGGDGGLVEVSGLGEVDVRGVVDTRAPAGQAGTFLIDPTDLEIGNFADSGVLDPGTGFEPSGLPSRLSWQTITNNLASGNVIVQTVSGFDAGQAGDITIVDGVTYGSANTLKLDAAGSIIVDAPVENTGDGVLYLRAQLGIEQFAEVSVAQLMLETAAGDIRFSADNNIGVVAALGSGAVRIENVGDLRIGSVTDATSGSTLLGIDTDGNIMLESFTGGITIAEDIASSAGFVSIQAEGVIAQQANLNASSTIDLEARAGSITMDAGTLSQTIGANIRYRAGVGPHVNSDISLAALDAGDALVSIWASRDILNQGAGAVNVTASGLRLVAGRDAGSTAAPLSTSVGDLAANVGASLYLENTSGLAVDEVGPVSVFFGLSDLSVLQFTDPALSGVRAGADASLAASGGDITVATLLDAGGDLLLDARGGGLILNTALQGGGNVSLLALHDLLQNANITAAGTLDLESVSGSVTMATGTSGSTTSGGNIRYAAGQDLNLTALDAGAGTVSLVAGRDIASGDITAAGLRAQAGRDINNLTTSVDTLAAAAGGNASINEHDGLTIGTVGPVSVNRGTGTVTDSALTGISAGTNANVIIQSGDLTVDGSTAAGMDLLLQTWAGNLALNAETSAGGNMTFNAGGDIAGTSLSANNPVSIDAGGDVTFDMVDAGRLNLVAGGDVNINNLSVMTSLVARVGGLFAGNVLEVEGSADIQVVGDVNYRNIRAGSGFNLQGGGSFTFETLAAGDVDVRVDDDARLGDVDATSLALVSGGSILRASGLIDAGTVSLEAAENVGEADARVMLRSGTVLGVIAGGTIYAQLAPEAGHEISLGLVDAGDLFDVLVPGQVTLVDGNGDALNLRAENTSVIDAYQVGTLDDALEVEIRNGVLRVTSRDSSGDDTPGDFVFVNLDGVIGGAGSGKPVQYFDDANDLINGFVIFNGQIIDGKPTPPEPPEPPDPPDPPAPRPPRPARPDIDLPELVMTLGLGGSPFFTANEIASAPAREKAMRYALTKQVEVRTPLSTDDQTEGEAIHSAFQRGGSLRERTLPLDGLLDPQRRASEPGPGSGPVVDEDDASLPPEQAEPLVNEVFEPVDLTEPAESFHIPDEPVESIGLDEAPIAPEVIEEALSPEEPLLPVATPAVPAPEPVAPEDLDALFEDWQKASGVADEVEPAPAPQPESPPRPVSEEEMDRVLQEWEGKPSAPKTSPLNPRAPLPPGSSKPVSEEQVDQILRDWESETAPATQPQPLNPRAPIPTRPAKPVTGEQMDNMLREWEREVGVQEAPPARKPTRANATVRPAITEEQLGEILKDWESSSGKNDEPPRAPAPSAPARQITADDLDKMLRDWEGEPDISSNDLDDMLSTWAASQD